MKQLLFRAIAVLLSVTFSVTSAVSYAQNIDLKQALFQSHEVSIPDIAGKIEIPEALGSVQNVHSSGPATIIHIQDAHGQIVAQKNIEKILTVLRDQYGFKTVFLEGGLKGEVNPGLLRFFKDRKLNEKLAQYFLEKGAIGGGGLFLLHSNGKAKTFGVEDARLYRKNLRQFRQIYQRKDSSDQFLKNVKTRLATLGSHYFNQDLKKFLNDWLLFQDSRADMVAHLNALDSAAKKYLKMDLHDPLNQFEYPQLLRYFKLKELTSSVIPAQAGIHGSLRSGTNLLPGMGTDLLDQSEQRGPSPIVQEQEKLSDWLKKNGLEEYLPVIARSEVTKQSLNFKIASPAMGLTARNDDKNDNFHTQRPSDRADLRTARASRPAATRAELEQFYQVAKPKGFTFKDYPHLSKQFGAIILKEELDATFLFKEIETLTGNLLKTLAKSDEEKKLISLYYDYQILGKLFALELTREEFDRVNKESNLIAPDAVIERMKALALPHLVLRGVKRRSNQESVSFPTRADRRSNQGTVSFLVKSEQRNNQGRLSFPHVFSGNPLLGDSREQLSGMTKRGIEGPVQNLFRRCLQFYQTANEREQVIFENVLSTLKQTKQDKAVLVTGGFHQEGIEAIAKEKGFSYLSIMPKINEIQDSQLYVNRMTLKPVFLSPASNVAPAQIINPMHETAAKIGRAEAQYLADDIQTGIQDMQATLKTSAQPDGPALKLHDSMFFNMRQTSTQEHTRTGTQVEMKASAPVPYAPVLLRGPGMQRARAAEGSTSDVSSETSERAEARNLAPKMGTGSKTIKPEPVPVLGNRSVQESLRLRQREKNAAARAEARDNGSSAEEFLAETRKSTLNVSPVRTVWEKFKVDEGTALKVAPFARTVAVTGLYTLLVFYLAGAHGILVSSVIAGLVSNVFYAVLHWNGVYMPHKAGPPVFKKFYRFNERVSMWGRLFVLGLFLYLPYFVFFPATFSIGPALSFMVGVSATTWMILAHLFYNSGLHHRGLYDWPSLLVPPSATLKYKLEHLAGFPGSGITPDMIESILKRVQDGKITLSGEDLNIIAEGAAGEIKTIGVIDARIAHEYRLLHHSANAIVFTPKGTILVQRRVHNKVKPLDVTIFGGHVKAGETIYRTAIDELAEEAGMSKDGVLEGTWKLIGAENGYSSDRTDPPNREKITNYMYFATSKEVEKALEYGRWLEEKKRSMTREKFKRWIEREQTRHAGNGETWAIYELTLEELLQAARGENVIKEDVFKDGVQQWNVKLTDDLLEPLLADKAVVDKLKSSVAAARVNREEVVRKIMEVREIFSQEKPWDEAARSHSRKLIDEALKDIRSVLSVGVDSDDPFLSLLYMAQVMNKFVGGTRGPSKSPRRVPSAQIFLIDQSGKKILFQKRGPYKRLFAGKLTVSANAKVNKETVLTAAADAIEKETGAKIPLARLKDVRLGENAPGDPVYYFYTLSDAEEQRLHEYYETNKAAFHADGIDLVWDQEKRSLHLVSIDGKVTADQVKAAAEEIRKKVGIPWIHPVFDLRAMVAAAVENETGLRIPFEKLHKIDSGKVRSGWLASYDFYALNEKEEKKLVAYQTAHQDQYRADGVLMDWDARKKSLCVLSVDGKNVREKIREIAGQIRRETNIPGIYPVFDKNEERLFVYQLTGEDAAFLKKKMEQAERDRRDAEAQLVDGGSNIFKTIDSDEMVFKTRQEIESEFQANPLAFALDLTGPYVSDSAIWEEIFPDILNVDDEAAASVEVAGGKGANTHILRQLMNSGKVPVLQVPDSSVLTTHAFERMVFGDPVIKELVERLEKTEDEDEIRMLCQQIRDRIGKLEFPKPLRNQIAREFKRLGGKIAVRSSATVEDLKNFAAAGQAKTKLYQLSVNQTLKSIKVVWASLFDDGFVTIRRRAGLSVAKAGMAVLLQKFIEPRSSGVAFSVDPDDSINRPIIKIDAVHGIGEGIVDGKIPVDKWKVGPMADAILEKKIQRKKQKVTTKPGGDIQTVDLSDEEADLPSLLDAEILEVARLTKLICRHYRARGLANNIDIEFAVDENGEIFIVQARAKIISEAKREENQAVFVVRTVDESQVPSMRRHVLDSNATAATHGAVYAQLQILKGQKGGSETQDKHLAAQVRPGVILVAHHTNNEFNDVFAKLAGVITTDGGSTSHAAQNSLPLQIPCLVGATDAFEKLAAYDGQMVTFDSGRRTIYLGKGPIVEERRTVGIYRSDEKMTPEEVLREMEPHEIFERWSMMHIRRSEVYQDFPEDGHLRKRSSVYRWFELDYYWQAWDRLTDVFERFFVGRTPWKLETQERVFKSSSTYKTHNPDEPPDTVRMYLYQRITRNDPHSIFYFVKNVRNLRAHDLQELFNARWTGLKTFGEVISGMNGMITKDNVETMVDGIIDAFVWMHIGFWLDVTVNHIFAFDQARYIDRNFREIMKDEAAVGLHAEFSIDENRKDIPKGLILKLSRQKDKEFYALIERVWSSPAVSEMFERHKDPAELAEKLREHYPQIYDIVEKWSTKYKKTSEHLDDPSDTLFYLEDIRSRILEGKSVTEEFLAALCMKHLEKTKEEELSLQSLTKDENLNLLMRGFVRVARAGTRKPWMVSAREVDAGLGLALEKIKKVIENQNAKMKTARRALTEYPQLKETMSLSHQEFLLREDGHHVIAPLQRRVARMMLEAAQNYLKILGVPQRIFDIGTDEVVALFKDSDPSYVGETFNRNRLFKKAEDGLSEGWKSVPEEAVAQYEKELEQVFEILRRQESMAHVDRVKRYYQREEKRLRDRIVFLRDTLSLLKLKELLNSRDKKRQELKAHVLLICGNDFLDNFQEAVELYNAHKISKILISGGLGKGTLSLIRNAVLERIPVHISDDEVITHESQIERLETLRKAGKLDMALKRREAEIIKEIILHMARNRVDQKGNPRPVPIDEKDIILETETSIITEYFEKTKPILKQVHQELGLSNNDPLVVAYMHDPVQQFRTKGTFAVSYADEIRDGKIEGVSYALDHDIYGLGRKTVKLNMLREMFALIIFTRSGDVRPIYNGQNGLSAIPEIYWKTAADLLGGFSKNDENRAKLRELFSGMIEGLRKRRSDFPADLPTVLSGLPKNLKAFNDALLELFDEQGQFESQPASQTRSEVRETLTEHPAVFDFYSPRVIDLSLVFNEEAAEQFVWNRGRGSRMLGGRILNSNEMPTVFDVESALKPVEDQVGGKYGAVTVYSYGNYLHNDWFVIYDGARQQVYHRKDEPVFERIYSMMVAWNTGAITSEDVRFVKVDGSGQVKVLIGDSTENRAAEVKTAFFGQRLIHHGAATPVQDIANQFDDLYHLYVLPQFITYNEQGKPQYGQAIGFQEFFVDLPVPGRPVDRRLLKKVLANDGEAEFDLAPYLNQEPNRYSIADIEEKALKTRGYKPKVGDGPLAEGEYRIVGGAHQKKLQVKLIKSKYPHNLIGITESGRVVAINLTGNKRKKIGYTIEEVQKMVLEVTKTRGDPIRELFLLANSVDVMKYENGVPVSEESSENFRARENHSALIVIPQTSREKISDSFPPELAGKPSIEKGIRVPYQNGEVALPRSEVRNITSQMGTGSTPMEPEPVPILDYRVNMNGGFFVPGPEDARTVEMRVYEPGENSPKQRAYKEYFEPIYDDVDKYIESQDLRGKVKELIHAEHQSIVIGVPTANIHGDPAERILHFKKIIADLARMKREDGPYRNWPVRLVININGLDQKAYLEEVRKFQRQYSTPEVPITVMHMPLGGRLPGEKLSGKSNAVNAIREYAQSINASIIGMMDDDIEFSPGNIESNIDFLLTKSRENGVPMLIGSSYKIHPGHTLTRRVLPVGQGSNPNSVRGTSMFAYLFSLPPLPSLPINEDYFLKFVFADPQAKTKGRNYFWRLLANPDAVISFSVAETFVGYLKQEYRWELGDRWVQSLLSPGKKKTAWAHYGVFYVAWYMKRFHPLRDWEGTLFELKRSLGNFLIRGILINHFVAVELWIRQLIGKPRYTTHWSITIPKESKIRAETRSVGLSYSDRLLLNRLTQPITNFLAAREFYDVKTANRGSVPLNEEELIQKDFDFVMVLGTEDERVPEETAILIKKLKTNQPDLPVMTVGMYGAHFGGYYYTPDGERIAESEFYKARLEENGVSVDSVENKSTNTGENVLNAKEILDAEKFYPKRVLVIENPWLQKRAAATLIKQAVWPELEEVIGYAPYRHDFNSRDLTDSDRIKLAGIAIGEIYRLNIAYKGKHTIPVIIPAEVMAAYKQLIHFFDQRAEKFLTEASGNAGTADFDPLLTARTLAVLIELNRTTLLKESGKIQNRAEQYLSQLGEYAFFKLTETNFDSVTDFGRLDSFTRTAEMAIGLLPNFRIATAQVDIENSIAQIPVRAETAARTRTDLGVSGKNLFYKTRDIAKELLGRNAHVFSPPLARAEVRQTPDPVRLYHEKYQKGLRTMRRYPGKGYRIILRGLKKGEDGNYHQQYFEPGAFAVIHRLDPGLPFVTAAHQSFHRYLNELKKIFPGREDQIRYWEVGENNVHLSMGVFQEHKQLFSRKDRKTFVPLNEDEKQTIRGMVKQNTESTKVFRLFQLGYGVTADGGFVGFFADPEDRFHPFMEQLNSEAKRLIGENRITSRPKFGHMAIGRIMELPYSDDPAIREIERAKVLALVRKTAQGFEDDWNLNVAEPSRAYWHTVNDMHLLLEHEWLSTFGGENTQYDFMRSELRADSIEALIRERLPLEFHDRFNIPNYPLQVHQEGPLLRDHLRAMVDVLNYASSYGEIPERFRAVLSNPANRRFFEEFILLHDIGKITVPAKVIIEEGRTLMLYPDHEAASTNLLRSNPLLAEGLANRETLIEAVRLHGALYFVEGVSKGVPSLDVFQKFVDQINPDVDAKDVLTLLIAADFIDTIATKRSDPFQPRVQNFAKAFEEWEVLHTMKRLALEAGKIMLRVKASKIEAQRKLDGSDIAIGVDPVIEEMVRKEVSALLPDSLVIGEEMFERDMGVLERAKKTRFVWVLDPLDGTRPYINGWKNYCFTLSLLDKGNPVYTVIYAPEFEMNGAQSVMVEVHSGGVFLNGQKFMPPASKATTLSEVNAIFIPGIEKFSARHYQLVTKKKINAEPSPGSGIISALLVAFGVYDAYLDGGSNLWDVVGGAHVGFALGAKVTDENSRDFFPVDFNRLKIVDNKPTVNSALITAQPQVHDLLMQARSEGRKAESKKEKIGGEKGYRARQQEVSLRAEGEAIPEYGLPRRPAFGGTPRNDNIRGVSLESVLAVAKEVAERTVAPEAVSRFGKDQILRSLIPEAFAETPEPVTEIFANRLSGLATNSSESTGVDPSLALRMTEALLFTPEGFVHLSSEDPIFSDKTLFPDFARILIRFQRDDGKPWLTISGKKASSLAETVIESGISRAQLYRVIKFTDSEFAENAMMDGRQHGAAILVGSAEQASQFKYLLVLIGDGERFQELDHLSKVTTAFSLILALNHLSAYMKGIKIGADEYGLLLKQYFTTQAHGFSLGEQNGYPSIAYVEFWQYLESLPEIQRLIEAAA